MEYSSLAVLVFLPETPVSLLIVTKLGGLQLAVVGSRLMQLDWLGQPERHDELNLLSQPSH